MSQTVLANLHLNQTFHYQLKLSYNSVITPTAALSLQPAPVALARAAVNSVRMPA